MGARQVIDIDTDRRTDVDAIGIDDDVGQAMGGRVVKTAVPSAACTTARRWLWKGGMASSNQRVGEMVVTVVAVVGGGA